MRLKLQMVFFLCLLGLSCGGCGDTGIPTTKDSEYRWMSMYLPWLDDSLLSGIGGSHVKRSIEPEIDLETCGGYVLYIAFGSNMYNCYAVLRVDSRGRAVACYQDVSTRKYMQKKFTVQHELMRTMQKVLVDNKAGSFEESYVDTNISDGTQGGFTIMTRKGVRRTYFSNEWPAEFRNIALFLQNKVLKFKNDGVNPGFSTVRQSMIVKDLEATKAVRGLLRR